MTLLAPRRFGLMLITDASMADESTARVVREVAFALPRGVLAVQLRDKQRAREAQLPLAAELASILRATQSVLLINGDTELANQVGADGVHFGASALPVAELRRQVPPPRLLSVAAHDDDAVASAAAAGADLALVSPIFVTPGKGPARGVGALRRARAIARASRRHELAIFALGGVEASTARSCVQAGADGVSVIRAVFHDADPATRALELYEAVRAAVILGRPMFNYEQMLQATTELLRRHVALDRTIKPTDHIQHDLGLDSLAVLEVVADIEDRFHVTVPNDLLERMTTVEDVARALVELQAQGPP